MYDFVIHINKMICNPLRCLHIIGLRLRGDVFAASRTAHITSFA